MCNIICSCLIKENTSKYSVVLGKFMLNSCSSSTALSIVANHNHLLKIMIILRCLGICSVGLDTFHFFKSDIKHSYIRSAAESFICIYPCYSCQLQ